MTKPLIAYMVVMLGGVLAQQVTDASSPTSTVIGNLMGIGSISFAVWYGWYVTSKVMPRMARAQRETIERIEASHEKQLQMTVDSQERQLQRIADTFSQTVSQCQMCQELIRDRIDADKKGD